MSKVIYLAILVACLAGCATVTKPNPVLTSNEEKWFIPKGTEFQAKKVATDNLMTFKASDDLLVLYFGEYVKLQKQADSCSK